MRRNFVNPFKTAKNVYRKDTCNVRHLSVRLMQLKKLFKQQRFRIKDLTGFELHHSCQIEELKVKFTSVTLLPEAF